MGATLLQVTSDYASPASIAWSTVTGLTFVVADTNVAHYFEASLMVYATGGSAIGHAVSCTGPTTSYLRYTWVIPTSATAVTMSGSNAYDHAIAVPTTGSPATATAPVETRICGMFVPTATGTFGIRIKPETASVMNVVRGSWGLVATP